MRVATVDGLVTLFYDGSRELYDYDLNWEWLTEYSRRRLIDGDRAERVVDLEAMNVSDECKRYLRERQTWQQVIIVDGVTEILENTFSKCENIERVIFADTVTRIKGCAFHGCKKLVFIKLPLNLDLIGACAFSY